MSDGWNIVYFIDEKSVEVVPEKWILVINAETYSFWPNIRSGSKISLAIKNKQEPQGDWSKYKVEYISKKVYTNFNLASMKANKATYTDIISSQSENENFTLKKRPIKRPSRYEESDDSNDDQLIDLPTPPNPLKLLKMGPNTTNSFVKVTQSPNVETASNSSNITTESCCSVQHTEEYRQIIKQLHILNGRLLEQTNLILSLLNKSEFDIEIEKGNIQETFCELPIQTNQDLENFDENLDEKTVDALVKKFARVGGNNLKEWIKRVMPRLIDDKVLKDYSWIGGKGKRKFSLLKIVNVVKGVCKVTSTTKMETEKGIESCLAIYLTKSSERCTRKEKRMEKVSSQAGI